MIEAAKIVHVATGLDHPEGLAIDDQGYLYAGGELGQIYRIDPEGRAEEICRTGGFSLGMNFGPDGYLYVCNHKLGAVLKVSVSGEWTVFAEYAGNLKLRVPNYPVFDRAGRLYVSDSGDWKGTNGRIYRFTPDGRGELFGNESYAFANGLAYRPVEERLYVVESNANRVVAIDIEPDGSCGEQAIHAEGLHNVPDGIALDAEGNMYVACFASNRIYKVHPSGDKEVLLEDPDGIFVSAPTNCFVGGARRNELYFTNLNSHFIGKVAIGED